MSMQEKIESNVGLLIVLSLVVVIWGVLSFSGRTVTAIVLVSSKARGSVKGSVPPLSCATAGTAARTASTGATGRNRNVSGSILCDTMPGDGSVRGVNPWVVPALH